jgi:hypothetical protein
MPNARNTEGFCFFQVLEPSLAKGNKVMVFCNTLNSSRAVDHFLSENQISTVNYHGEVPAEERCVSYLMCSCLLAIRYTNFEPNGDNNVIQ